MFNMKFKFSVVGLIIFLLPMIINLVYAIVPPVNEPSQEGNVNKIIESVEQLTRVLFAIAICILVSKQKYSMKSPWLYIGLVSLVLYYVVWIRYFINGRDIAYLSKSFIGIPMPLAVFPVIYFICEAVWVHNYIAVIIMIIFGIAHNIVSYSSLK